MIKQDSEHYTADTEADASAVGYEVHKKHAAWHYISQGFSRDHTEQKPASTPNIQTQLRAMREIIASADAPDSLKSYALTWLIHLVGDVHQPLHCVSRATKEQGPDAGGNKVAITCKGCNSDNLHSFWDSALGRGGVDESEKYLDSQKGISTRRGNGTVVDDETWIKESSRIARDWVYKPIKGDPSEPSQLPPGYQKKARKCAHDRVVSAGIRLGYLLNTELR